MFRRIAEDDRDLFIKFVEEFYSGDAVLHKISKDKIEKTFEEIISSDTYLEGFILFYGAEECGYSILSKSFSPEAGGICIWVEEIYIRKEYQGKKIGGSFLEYVENNYTFARLRLEIEKGNERAKKLYVKNGYKMLEYAQMYKDII